jgi:baculoviral IAP repeat-containing protein 7/8
MAYTFPSHLYHNGSFINTCYLPMHHKYISYEKRLETFANWTVKEIEPVDFVNAGFFAKQEADKVCCYFCNVHLCRWEPDDKPVIEHVKWSPECKFLYIKYGKYFIDSCRLNKKLLPAHVLETPSLDIDRYVCKVCFTNEVNCTLVPCEHAAVCTECVLFCTRCPLCRASIQEIYRLKFVN